MAAERDEAGTAGAGLSGTGRDSAGLEAGTTGSAAMGDRGTAEVHSGLHSGGTGEEYAGLGFAPEHGGRLRNVAGTVRDTAGSVAGTVRSTAGNVAGRARDVAGNVGQRAAGLASSAASRANAVGDRARTALEERGMLDRLRENPLPVLGVAFAVGFILAGGNSRSGAGYSKAGRARRELRGAVMAGLSAGVAQGARGFLNSAGTQGGGFVNGMLQGLLGNLGGGGNSGGGSDWDDEPASSRGGSYAGTSTHRPPSHQENL